ncbi:MAG: LCP family protein [Acidimicrobiia bacterium]|jgi:LCP family protein required for cell wall assembly|nr:MAG: LCP family protein [Acidimicrobiia bacterium]
MTARPPASDVRRRWRWILALLALANVVVFGALGYLGALRSAVVDEVTVLPGIQDDLAPKPAGEGDPIVFLVLGSDSREGLPEEWLDDFGVAGGERADVIMLVQVIPGDGRIQVLSIPRDLRVSIPGRDGKDKINAAFAFGGSELMIQTVQAEFEIGIHHYVELDFAGFAAMVDEVGGIEISFPNPARDLKSGLSVDAGLQVLDGRQALALARSRSYQELRNGSWVFVDATDFGRTRRQQQVIVALIEAVRSPSTLVEGPGLVTSLARHMTVDPGFREIDFGGLLVDFRSFRPSQIDSATLPGAVDTIGGVSYVVPIADQADAVVEAFRTAGSMRLVVGSDGPPSIEVLNGNGVAGTAGRWSDWLAARGVEVAEVGDADRDDYETTLVVATPATVARAEELIDLLGFGEVSLATLDEGLDLILILGRDAGEPEA